MQDWLAARATISPDKTAIIETLNAHEVKRVAYRHLNEQVAQMCARFAQAGMQRGDRVALLMMSSALAVVPFFAAMRMGLVFVPLNTRLSTEELAFQLEQTRCRWLLPYGPAEPLSALRDRGFPALVLSQQKPAQDVVQRYRSGEIDLDAPFFIVHTSGTSGQPKGAVLSYRNVYQSAMASAYRSGHLPDDVWLCVLPLYHVGGLSILIRAVLYGITVELRPKFDVQAVNDALTRGDISLVSLVPTMLYRLLEHRTQPWNDRLRLVLLGGAAPSPELVQRCLVENVPIATTYGLSEAASQVATALPELVTRKPGTVGKPLLFTQVRIVDEDGADVAAGTYGEVLVRGETVMLGYDGNPQATAHTLRDGWLHTGDIGYLDEEGDLFLVQRRSDLIVTGGENVYPAEVEGVLRQHPAVKEVAVVGIDHPEWGQQVAAALVLHAGQALSTAALHDYARAHLAGYKLPRRVLFVAELPQTASGKIQRSAVRALFS